MIQCKAFSYNNLNQTCTLYNLTSSDLGVLVKSQAGADYFEKLNTSSPATLKLALEGNKKLETKLIKNFEEKGMLRVDYYGKSIYKNVE